MPFLHEKSPFLHEFAEPCFVEAQRIALETERKVQAESCPETALWTQIGGACGKLDVLLGQATSALAKLQANLNEVAADSNDMVLALQNRPVPQRDLPKSEAVQWETGKMPTKSRPLCGNPVPIREEEVLCTWKEPDPVNFGVLPKCGEKSSGASTYTGPVCVVDNPENIMLKPKNPGRPASPIDFSELPQCGAKSGIRVDAHLFGPVARSSHRTAMAEDWGQIPSNVGQPVSASPPGYEPVDFALLSAGSNSEKLGQTSSSVGQKYHDLPFYASAVTYPKPAQVDSEDFLSRVGQAPKISPEEIAQQVEEDLADTKHNRKLWRQKDAERAKEIYDYKPDPQGKEPKPQALPGGIAAQFGSMQGIDLSEAPDILSSVHGCLAVDFGGEEEDNSGAEGFCDADGKLLPLGK